ncbi:serine/threonine protein kinase [Dactylosporangium aurantiacum]|uniref:non-specific serine/threonine protein kinase n=1 Tax=Dactylosporangium aurantiacum TaxID=35754 RepID=A0A9Q9IE74_9ACTN|nr:serine/threonine-protein kinase [Dactylosporangium aurantiacum]MDG6101775.1 serine/threonine-protein kinase [Dactylosporangium aurantiacum]UWZ52417.1 serine/threonine protein kinase [Dactylosporangium aurantiacum]
MVTAPRIRGYRDLTLISARGGQAHVFRAHKATMDGSPVAIKVYKQDLDDADQRRFLREVEALRALRGRPHVVRLLEADLTADGAGYVVMDLYAASVADRLADGRTLPVADVLRIGAQVAEALMYAHEAPTRILHRDIKPSNILLADDGSAVLTDFGISAIWRTDGAYTATARIGTRGYMAPEIHAGHADSVASDLYSLGATLHTLLLGEPPSALAPAAQLPTVPEPLAAVLCRALSPDPAQRPESARRLREDLLQATARETGAFAAAPPAATRVMPERPAAPARVHPRLLETPVADPDLGRNIGVGLAALLGALGLLTLLDWVWWAGALLVAVPIGAAVALRAALHARRLAGPAAAASLACYAVPVVTYAARLGEHPFVNLGMLALVLVAFGGQVTAIHEIERYVRQDLAQAEVARANEERRQLFESSAGRYWLDGADPPPWLDDVLGALPAARAMPWRDGLVRHAVVCDRSVVLVTVLDGARPGSYDLDPAGGHPCRVFADGRPNTSVDTRLRELARRVDGVGWGAAGVSAGCVVVLTTDGTRSDGIRLAPAQFDSTSLTVVVAPDVATAVIRLLAGAERLVIDPVLLRAVWERAARA